MKILEQIWIRRQLLSFPSFAKLANSILLSFGLLWLVVEITDYFFKAWAMDNIQHRWYLFPIMGTIVAVWRNISKTSFMCKIHNTDTFVEIRIGDIFDMKETIVVSTNTTFDTSIEDNVISPKSIQGQFTHKYCNVEELDQKLATALKGVPSTSLSRKDKPFGKEEQYPIGTAVKISCQLRTAYFLAIAHMNANKTAHSSSQNILDALPKLWGYIRSNGEIENICMPIIGSRFARINVTKETLIQEIIRSFVAACGEGKFCEKITLLVHPEDIKEKKIDFDTVTDFLKYICTYENKKIGMLDAEVNKSKVIDKTQHDKHIRATCFLLEDDKGGGNFREDFRNVIENVAGSLEKAIPVLLEAKNLNEFIRKCDRSIVIDELKFDPHASPKDQLYKYFSTGIVSLFDRRVKQWAIDFDNNVYMNEIAKFIFDKEFINLKVDIEKA